MSCDKVRGLFQDYVTRELGPGKRRLVDEHLLECEGCRKELALMSAIVSSLDSQSVLEPSAEFSHRVMSALPRQSRLVLSPWLSLVLVPILGGLMYLFRVQLATGLLGVLDRFGIDLSGLAQFQMPDLSNITMLQLAVVPLAAVVLGLGLSIGTAAFCWRYYSEG